MKIKDLTYENRPIEKLLNFGSENLTNSELLAIILKTGTRNINVVELADMILKKIELNKINDHSLNELKSIKGIGITKASQLVALAELSKRINLISEKKTKIKQALDIYNFFKYKLADKKQEHFIVVNLDSKNKIINYDIIFKGTLNYVIIHPREIFNFVIRNNANAFIIVHNHPSGITQPSNEDIRITKRIYKISKILDIKLLDHIIVSKESYFSFKENNIIIK